MATQPEAIIEQAAEQGGSDDGPPDYITEAKRFGWTDKEDFAGKPEHWVDAETFVKRSQEVMPILKAQNRALVKRLDAMEREGKKAAEFFSKSEQRAYERALTEIRAEQEAAVESGDVEAHRAASKKLDQLEKPEALKPDEITPEQRAEDLGDWGKANKWYATNAVMKSYADAQAGFLAGKKGGYLDRADLDTVSEKVRAKFEDEYPEAFGTGPKPKPRSPVEGVQPGRGKSNGNAYADLPPEAKAMCDKWVKNGQIKSREDYVKGFDFKGWNG